MTTDDSASASPRAGSRRARDPRPAQTARRNPRAKHVRTRTGCWNCRRKRKKCELAHRGHVVATLAAGTHWTNKSPSQHAQTMTSVSNDMQY